MQDDDDEDDEDGGIEDDDEEDEDVSKHLLQPANFIRMLPFLMF